MRGIGERRGKGRDIRSGEKRKGKGEREKKKIGYEIKKDRLVDEKRRELKRDEGNVRGQVRKDSGKKGLKK